MLILAVLVLVHAFIETFVSKVRISLKNEFNPSMIDRNSSPETVTHKIEYFKYTESNFVTFESVLSKHLATHHHSLHFSLLHQHLFIQTLTQLNLYNNEIVDQGAQSISQALLKNTVRHHHSLHSMSKLIRRKTVTQSRNGC